MLPPVAYRENGSQDGVDIKFCESPRLQAGSHAIILGGAYAMPRHSTLEKRDWFDGLKERLEMASSVRILKQDSRFLGTEND
jgi:hypothetical protein